MCSINLSYLRLSSVLLAAFRSSFLSRLLVDANFTPGLQSAFYTWSSFKLDVYGKPNGAKIKRNIAITINSYYHMHHFQHQQWHSIEFQQAMSKSKKSGFNDYKSDRFEGFERVSHSSGQKFDQQSHKCCQQIP